VNLNVALGSTRGTATLYRGPGVHDGMSTLDPELGAQHQRAGHPTEEVPVTTLADVAATYVHGPVDFVKVDVEGREHDVLLGMDWDELHPTVLVVEATVPGSSEPAYEDWEPLVLEHGYAFTLFDGLNRFYLDRAAADYDVLAERLSVAANVLDDFLPYRVDHELKSLHRALDERAAALAAASARAAAAEALLAAERGRLSHRAVERAVHLARQVPLLSSVLGRSDEQPGQTT
jgi:hypothetical protein